VILFPIVAAGISAVFAAVLLRRWAQRRTLPLLAWGIALAMYALASVAVILGVASRWDATLYRIFWLFGVMLNVPWLALGSIALIGGKGVRVVSTIAVSALSVYALVLVVGADPNTERLASVDDIPRGSEIWAAGDPVQSIGRWYSIVAWVVVVGIAVWSSRARKGMKPPVARVRANSLIAAGATITAIGGFALARIGGGAAVGGFSVALAAGVTVMFAGFLLSGRAPRFTVEDPGESPT